MDKSVQQLYGNITRNSFGSISSRAHQTPSNSFSSSLKRKSYVGGTAAALKKTSSAGIESQGRFSASGRSNQSILGVHSEYNLVESYGYQVPILVNEAMNFSERNHMVSMQCSENGWAWVAYGRELFIWQYKDVRQGNEEVNLTPHHIQERLRAAQRRGGMAQCRELTLPHCDIGHKASLISVYQNPGQQLATCIAASPTGDVRYWASIAHDGSSVDLTGILDGQEFDHLLYLPKQNGYLLVTTTCNLVFLQLKVVKGRYVLNHRPIKQSSGLLSGIGKKFASIVIGLNSGNEKENKFVSFGFEDDKDDTIVTMVADRWIQRWRISNKGNMEHLLYEDSEILRSIRDEFQSKFWNVRMENIDIVLHLLDMHIFEEKIYVLAGAVNSGHTPQMYYAIAILSANDDAMTMASFIPLKLSQFYSIGTERECLSLRFIICTTHLYLYTSKVVYPINLMNPGLSEIDSEKVEFHMQDDRILSAAVCNNIPLFFSNMHGLVSITPNDFDNSDYCFNASYNTTDVNSPNPERSMPDTTIMSSSMTANNLYMFDLDPDLMYNEFKDEVSQLKAAFVYHLKRKNNMCTVILNELLRSTTEGQTDTLTDVNQMDKIVITIAEDLAEDIPAADPRWEQLWEENNGNRHALGSSSSMQIITQLKEKNLALRHFVEFLHSTGIWDKLNAVPSCGGTVVKPTCYVISDINEKIIAAITLRNLQIKYPKMIDDAINRTVSAWNENPHGNLTTQDLFYVHICKFQDVFQAFCDVADSRIESHKQTISVAAIISEVNSIILQIVTEVTSHRAENFMLFSVPVEQMDSYEYLPWTAMSGNLGLRDTLSHLVDISIRYGVQCATEPEIKQKLYQQIYEIIDIILDGRKSYLASVRDTEKFNVLQQQYESQRRDLISILIEDGQYEYAAKLAEKYLDFQSLVLICDATNNQDRLDAYIKKFEEYDFSQFAINWHLRQNRQGEVFERFKSNQAALSQFLRDHPTLGWIQLVFNGDFERAAKILYQLAQAETEYVQRKKSMLSLAKLATFAADDTTLQMQIENINTELNIIDYQEQLNKQVLDAFGYDVENQKVLKVDEIINLLISEENESGCEYDFRSAMELLNFMEEPYEARHKIWCAAILRDNWIQYDMNNAADYIQNLLFFKIAELSHLLDGDFDQFLPPMEEFLNSPDLADLAENNCFKYLFKLTYESIHDSFKKGEDDSRMED